MNAKGQLTFVVDNESHFFYDDQEAKKMSQCSPCCNIDSSFSLELPMGSSTILPTAYERKFQFMPLLWAMYTAAVQIKGPVSKGLLYHGNTRLRSLGDGNSSQRDFLTGIIIGL